jgi:hypothetical protein
MEKTVLKNVTQYAEDLLLSTAEGDDTIQLWEPKTLAVFGTLKVFAIKRSPMEFHHIAWTHSITTATMLHMHYLKIMQCFTSSSARQNPHP